MLIVANGAYKSGSTWLYRIAKDITGSKRIPAKFQNPRWSHPSIDPPKLEQFLAEVDFRTATIVVKAHLRRPAERDLLLADPDVRVLDIRRDIRDVVVSAFYHEDAHNTETTFNDWYWERGRDVARMVEDYHALWAGHQTTYCARYEGLLDDFDAEVTALGRFLGAPVTADDLDRIREATDFRKLQKQEQAKGKPTPFHRKGIAGDWRNHFDEKSLADLAALVPG